jgi:hypothetical protein
MLNATAAQWWEASRARLSTEAHGALADLFATPGRTVDLVLLDWAAQAQPVVSEAMRQSNVDRDSPFGTAVRAVLLTGWLLSRCAVTADSYNTTGRVERTMRSLAMTLCDAAFWGAQLAASDPTIDHRQSPTFRYVQRTLGATKWEPKAPAHHRIVLDESPTGLQHLRADALPGHGWGSFHDAPIDQCVPVSFQHFRAPGSGSRPDLTDTLLVMGVHDAVADHRPARLVLNDQDISWRQLCQLMTTGDVEVTA